MYVFDMYIVFLFDYYKQTLEMFLFLLLEDEI